MNKAIDEPTNIIISIIWKLLGVMVPYIATGIPSTIHILKILEPIMLPISKSCSPLRDDIQELILIDQEYKILLMTYIQEK